MNKIQFLRLILCLFCIYDVSGANISALETEILKLASFGMPMGYFMGDPMPVCWITPPNGARYQINDCRLFNISIKFDTTPPAEMLTNSINKIAYRVIVDHSDSCDTCIFGMAPMPNHKMHANTHYCEEDISFCTPFLMDMSNMHMDMNSMGTTSPSQLYELTAPVTHFQFNFSTEGIHVGTNPSLLIHTSIMTMSPEGAYTWDIANTARFKVIQTMDYHFFANSTKIGCFVAYGVTLFFILCYGIWTWWNSGTKIVRCSQPMFLQILLLGAIIYTSSIIPSSAEDTLDNQSTIEISSSWWLYNSCMLKYWFASLGFAIMFGTLFSKMYRAYKVVTMSMKLRQISVDGRFVFKAISMISLVFIVFMILWQVIEPLYPVRVFESSESSILVCQSENGRMVFVGLWYGMQLAMLFCGCVLAYHGFSMNSVVNESKFIALALVCLLQTFFTSLPVMYLLQDRPEIYWGIWCAITVFCTNVTLGFIFVPKIIALHTSGDDVGNMTGSSSGVGSSRSSTVIAPRKKHAVSPESNGSRTGSMIGSIATSNAGSMIASKSDQK